MNGLDNGTHYAVHLAQFFSAAEANLRPQPIHDTCDSTQLSSKTCAIHQSTIRKNSPTSKQLQNHSTNTQTAKSDEHISKILTTGSGTQQLKNVIHSRHHTTIRFGTTFNIHNTNLYKSHSSVPEELHKKLTHILAKLRGFLKLSKPRSPPSPGIKKQKLRDISPPSKQVCLASLLLATDSSAKKKSY